MRLLPPICGAVLLAVTACASDEPKESNTATAPAAVPGRQPEQVVVTDANGMTVYYFIKDGPNKSLCNDECSSKYWFPVRPQPGLEGDSFNVIKREDGTEQLAFKGRPLYTYYRDSEPGEMKGDGQRGRWFALRF